MDGISNLLADIRKNQQVFQKTPAYKAVRLVDSHKEWVFKHRMEEPHPDGISSKRYNAWVRAHKAYLNGSKARAGSVQTGNDPLHCTRCNLPIIYPNWIGKDPYGPWCYLKVKFTTMSPFDCLSYFTTKLDDAEVTTRGIKDKLVAAEKEVQRLRARAANAEEKILRLTEQLQEAETEYNKDKIKE